MHQGTAVHDDSLSWAPGPACAFHRMAVRRINKHTQTVASTTQQSLPGLLTAMSSTGVLNPRYSISVAPYDAASAIHQSLGTTRASSLNGTEGLLFYH